jgi:hydrogenase-4 component E
VSGTLAWMVVGLGLLVLVVRRRSLAVAIVTVQALLLAAKALEDASTRGEVGAALALGVRAVALAALFTFVVARTREPRPVRAGTAPLVRAGAGIGFALALIWLVPQLGLGSRSVERAVLALVAFGPAGSALIEFGVAFDLLLVALVAVVFHERIFTEFGAGDTAALRSLRDHP